MGNYSSRLQPKTETAMKAGLIVNEKSSKLKENTMSSIKEQGVPSRTDELCTLICELAEKIREEMNSVHDQYFHLLESCDEADELHKQYNEMPYQLREELHKRDFPNCLWLYGVWHCDAVKRDITSVQAKYHKLKLECERLSDVQKQNVQDDDKKKWFDAKDFYKNILKLAGLTVNENASSGFKLQGAPSQPGELFKLIYELCEKIKDEFSSLYMEYLNLKPKSRKFRTKKSMEDDQFRNHEYRGISYDLDDKLHKKYHEMPHDINYELHKEDFKECLWFKAVKACDHIITNTLSCLKSEYFKLKVLCEKLATEKEVQRPDEMIEQEKKHVVKEDSDVKIMATNAASYQDENECDFEREYYPEFRRERLYKGVKNIKERRRNLQIKASIKAMQKLAERRKKINLSPAAEQNTTPLSAGSEKLTMDKPVSADSEIFTTEKPLSADSEKFTMNNALGSATSVNHQSLKQGGNKK